MHTAMDFQQGFIVWKPYQIAPYFKDLIIMKQNLQLDFDKSAIIGLAAIILRWDPYTF